MKGSRDLKFEPAKTQGRPVPVSILLPVFFRHPDAPPLAGDSVLKRDSTAASSTSATIDTARADTTKSTASAAKATTKAPARRTATRRKR
jgi:hypothetical protein